MLVGLPLSWLLFRGLPEPTSEQRHFALYSSTLFVMGLLVRCEEGDRVDRTDCTDEGGMGGGGRGCARHATCVDWYAP